MMLVKMAICAGRRGQGPPHVLVPSAAWDGHTIWAGARAAAALSRTGP